MKTVWGDASYPIASNNDGIPFNRQSEGCPSQEMDSTKADWHRPPEGFEFVNSSSMDRSKSTQRPQRSPSAGIRAPRSSLMTEIYISPRIPSPLPDYASRSLPPTPPADTVEEIKWQDYEIPEELGNVREGTPKEIRDIIQETFDEHRAMRGSKLRAHAIVVRTTIETTGTKRRAGQPVAAECTANISARSTPSVDHPDNRSGSSLSTDTSVTTPGSENSGSFAMLAKKTSSSSSFSKSTRSLKSRNSQQSLGSSKSRPMSPSQSVLSTRMAAVESKLQESKDRTTESQKLFKMVPRKKSKSPPPPSFFYPQEPESYECTGCLDSVPRKRAVQGLMCRHRYCTACFSQLVCTAILAEATFPPRCCDQEIPRQVLRSSLSPKALATYDDKALEYAVPVENRYYCVSQDCGRWIDTRIARRANGSLVCPHCRTAVCPICRGPRHSGNEDCPQDEGIKASLRRAERAGWQRCYNCRSMVQNQQGRRHVICKCRAEFCNVCGSRWRTCHCTEADQAHRDKQLARRHARRSTGSQRGEEEIYAATAAIEAAERIIQRDRRDDEACMVAETTGEAAAESHGKQRANAHFTHLRKVLDSVRFQQRQSLEKSHERDDRAIREMEERRDALVAQRERDIRIRILERVRADNETILRSLQRRHATIMMETIARHRHDQDELLASPSAAAEASSRLSMVSTSTVPALASAELTDDLLKATILENLLPAQEAERKTLKSQQSREKAKWRSRGDQALRTAESEAKSAILKMRLEEAERVEMCARRLRRRVQAEWKWFSVLWDDRCNMLRDDETGTVGRAGDVMDRPSLHAFSSSSTSSSTPTIAHPNHRHGSQRRPNPRTQRYSDDDVDVLEPHPGTRVYYGPTNSWMEREEKRAGELREKRGRRAVSTSGR